MHTVKHGLPMGDFTGLCLFSAALQSQMRLSPLHLGSLCILVSTYLLASLAAIVSIHLGVLSLHHFSRSHHNSDLIMSFHWGAGPVVTTLDFMVVLNSLQPDDDVHVPPI